MCPRRAGVLADFRDTLIIVGIARMENRACKVQQTHIPFSSTGTLRASWGETVCRISRCPSRDRSRKASLAMGTPRFALFKYLAHPCRHPGRTQCFALLHAKPFLNTPNHFGINVLFPQVPKRGEGQARFLTCMLKLPLTVGVHELHLETPERIPALVHWCRKRASLASGY